MKNIEDIYELSPTQQGMLFHCLSSPGSGVYHEQFCYALEGDLDYRRFKHAWQKTAQRHAVLRSSIVWKESEKLLQVVRRRVKLPCRLGDLSGRPEAVQKDRLQAYLEADRRKGFDFETAPLTRVALFRVGSREHWMVWSFHHMLLDGWSVPIVLRDLFAFYEAGIRRRRLQLPPARPYRDYISWLQKQDLSEAKAFWQESLAGFTSPTRLGSEEQSGEEEGVEVEPGQIPLRLSREETQALQASARRLQVTLNTLVEGAWALLLGRYTQSRDVVFGVTVSGRPAELEGMESMVGLFINTLPARVQIPPQALCRDWLRDLQAWQAKARAYEYTPLLQVQKWSPVPAGRPLFEAVLVFENYFVGKVGPARKSSLTTRHLRTAEKMSYALSAVVDPGEELGLRILFDPARFEADFAERMAGHLRCALEGLASAQPEQRLHQVPLLTPSEVRRLLDWSRRPGAWERLGEERLAGLYAKANGNGRRVFVASADQQMVPLGVPGQVCCGGSSLVPGFPGRPRLTALQFVPDALSGEAGMRLFQSGIQARCLPGGEVEPLEGDSGFESGFGEASPHLGEGSGKRLVAYAVLEEDQADSRQAELRAFIRRRLPEYMVPASFVFLDRLPRLANGKIDRAALPLPDWSRPDLEEGYSAPATPQEEVMAEIWSKVLGPERVGVYDDFFELGGDSILAIQITARAGQAGMALTPDQIFRHSTIAELSAHGFLNVEGEKAPQTEAEAKGEAVAESEFPLSGLSPSQIEGLRNRYPELEDIYALSPMQSDMVLHTLAVPDSRLGLMQFCWTLRGGFDAGLLEEAWRRVVARHAVLRTSFWWKEAEGLVQIVHRRVELPFRQLDWSGLAEAGRRSRLQSLLESDRRRGFAMDRAPLVRFSLALAGEQEAHLVWSFHHALLDGWCQSLILKEFVAHYRMLAKGLRLRLAQSAPYRGYIGWLQSRDASEAERFWRGKLRGFKQPTPIGGRRSLSGAGSASEPAELAEEVTEALSRLARRNRLTLNTLVQGAWAILLGFYSGVQDVVFGVTVSGRPTDLEGVESMIGLFINNLPARVQVHPESLLIPWLQQLQEDQLDMRRYEYASQSQIRQWSEVPPSRPLYESMLVFENYPARKVIQGRRRGLALRLSDHFGTGTSSPLSLFSEAAERLPLQLVYQRSRFGQPFAERMLKRLCGLLTELAGMSPQTRIADLSLWSEPRESVREGSFGSLGDETAAQIEAALLSHPAVSEALVVERAGSTAGPAWMAYLGSGTARTADPRQLRRYLRSKLPDIPPPSDIVVLPELPRLAEGGVDREALPPPEQSLGWSRRNTLVQDFAGQDVLEVQLAQIWEDVFDIRPIDPLDDFFELGGTSLLAVSLVSRIQQQLGYNLPLAVLFEGATIRGMAQQLRRMTRTDPWSALVPIKPGGSKRPFFAVHPAGGNLLNFTHLARRLDPERPFYGLQAVGLDGRQEPLERIEDMADHYIEKIRTVQPRGPYLLGGQSFGGYVAYEMACRLQRQGEEVALLALLETWSPLYRNRLILETAFPDEAAILSALARTAAVIYGRRFDLSAQEIRQAGAEGQLEYTLERIRRQGVMPAIGLEQTRRIMKVHQGAIRAGRSYRPPPYPGRITVFRAPVIERWLVELNKHPGFGDDELWWGWGGLSSQPLRVCTIPDSTHSNFILEPHVEVLARHLEECFREAEQEGSHAKPQSRKESPKR